MTEDSIEEVCWRPLHHEQTIVSIPVGIEQEVEAVSWMPDCELQLA